MTKEEYKIEQIKLLTQILVTLAFLTLIAILFQKYSERNPVEDEKKVIREKNSGLPADAKSARGYLIVKQSVTLSLPRAAFYTELVMKTI